MNPTDNSQKNYHLSYPNAMRTVLTPGFKNYATQIYLTDFSISGPLVGMNESRNIIGKSIGLSAFGAFGLHSFSHIQYVPQISTLTLIAGVFGIISGTYMFKTCVDGWNEVANSRKKSIENNELMFQELMNSKYNKNA